MPTCEPKKKGQVSNSLSPVFTDAELFSIYDLARYAEDGGIFSNAEEKISIMEKVEKYMYETKKLVSWL